ncbi:O-antigen ligase family protein [Allorhodopirellula heiligendammensis]|uniref:O-Antigen ligase n=1 Tax=Allorhodopirellula heiligendammensis TaxID=2714739 RepID=A0A5C6C762_9BACT|nr:O-antigen ligase family protein [Allorhodopirellula heiligendammensis]TWU19998.1 O-Antigen ligase [Allorhodopirellula heiligendammensis]
MSLTAIIWLGLFLTLTAKGFSRPIWSVCAYLMTYFAAPQFWWWGRSGMLSMTTSWNLYAACALALTVAMHWPTRQKLTSTARRTYFLLVLFSINAGLVHFLFASNPLLSYTQFDLAWKQSLLAVLTYFAVQSKEDLRIFLIALFCGCVYVGFEVVVRDAGSIERGRLEGIHLPGASDSNGVSGLLTMGLMIGAYLFVSGKSTWPIKTITVLGSVWIVEVLLRCNSRGAFLAAIASTGWLIWGTRGAARKRILTVCALGVFGILMMAQDSKIFERFSTTFAGEEERDASADERLQFWKAALRMLADHPLGSGGEAAFASDLGVKYIADIRNEYRAVHNGYLDIATGWGAQGFLLFAMAIGSAAWNAYKVLAESRRDPNGSPEALDSTLVGATVLGILISQLIVAMFISSLDNEWFYWCTTLLLLYAACYQLDTDSPTSDSWDA